MKRIAKNHRLSRYFTVAVFLINALALGGEHGAAPASPGARKADTPAAPTEQEITLAAANNRFAFKLYGQLAAEKKDQNIVVSPFSAFIALGLLYNASKGDTRKEILKALQSQQLTEKDLNDAVQAYLSALKSGDDYQLLTANQVMLAQGLNEKPAFLKKVEGAYAAAVKNLTGENAQDLKAINDWVEKKAKIPNMLEKLPPNVQFVLLNATYFKGSWKTPFEPPTLEAFTGADGKPIGEVKDGKAGVPTLVHPSMRVKHVGGERGGKDTFEAVQLPYGATEKGTSMTIILPPAGKPPTVDADQWTKIRADLEKATVDKGGYVSIPAFSTKSEHDLIPAMKKMGVKKAFDESAADFGGLTDKKGIWLSDVKQKAFINVNERGTEAGAATVALGRSRGGSPFSMQVNRPFFYAITDDRTGAILFMGTVTDPTK